MAIREIPAAFEHACDACGKAVQKPTKSRPEYWCGLVVEQDAYDYQGHAVADATIRRVLCGECKTVVVKAINDSIAARAALAGEAK